MPPKEKSIQSAPLSGARIPKSKPVASPNYEDDDGPMTEKQIEILRKWIPQEPFEVDCGSL